MKETLVLQVTWSCDKKATWDWEENHNPPRLRVFPA